MNNDKVKTGGNRVRGSIEPFKDNEFLNIFDNIIYSRGSVNLNDLDCFREMCKDLVSQRMKTTMCTNCKISVISEKSEKIIYEKLSKLSNPHIYGFVDCAIKYYNNQKNHIVELNKDNSSCNSRDLKKSFSHARTDCSKLCKVYVDKILKKMNTNEWTNVEEDTVLSFAGVKKAVEDFSKYIAIYHLRNLPKCLDLQTYKAALVYDKNLSSHYTQTQNGNIYELDRKKKNLYNTLSQECATYIIWNVVLQ